MRYARCENHAQAIWAENSARNRKATITRRYTPRTTHTPAPVHTPRQRLIVSIGEALPMLPTAPPVRRRRFDWRRIACQRPRFVGIPRSAAILPAYEQQRIVVANYVTQSVVTLRADIIDDQPMADLRRDLRARLQTEAARGSLVIEYP